MIEIVIAINLLVNKCIISRKFDLIIWPISFEFSRLQIFRYKIWINYKSGLFNWYCTLKNK